MHIHDELYRRNRYAPTSTGKRVTLKPRDLIWLQMIARHGPLPSHYLHAATSDTHANSKAARFRLTDLTSEANTPHHGPYLIRPQAQRRIENARNRSLIYDLSEHAWTALGLARSDVVRTTGPFAHQVMVASVTASIELATLQRSDVKSIPGSDILEKTADFGTEVGFRCQNSGKIEHHKLVPDQLFALAFQTTEGARYRAFVVECDRGTEPITSPNMMRKSYLRNYLQYREFIGRGLYKKQYGLKCPLLVLNVMSTKQRQHQFQELILKHSPNGNSYMLFKTVDAFVESFCPRTVLEHLLSEPWERAGMAPLSLTTS